jgi:hypothetical protein
MTYEDLTDFLDCYNPESRHDREETERFKAYEYDELIERGKTNLDIFWLEDDSLEDTENLLSRMCSPVTSSKTLGPHWSGSRGSEKS